MLFFIHSYISSCILSAILCLNLTGTESSFLTLGLPLCCMLFWVSVNDLPLLQLSVCSGKMSRSLTNTGLPSGWKRGKPFLMWGSGLRHKKKNPWKKAYSREKMNTICETVWDLSSLVEKRNSVVHVNIWLAQYRHFYGNKITWGREKKKKLITIFITKADLSQHWPFILFKQS